MSKNTQVRYLAILLPSLMAPAAFVKAQPASPTPKTKLAVLKIVYDDFSKEERERIHTAFYAHLNQDERLAVISEKDAQAEMQRAGIDPAVLMEAGYIDAGKLLRVDYILAGKMEKVGDFVEATFRLFKVSLQTQAEYSGGKTLEVFVKQEIQKIVEKIRRDIEPPPTIAPPPAGTVGVALPKPPVQEPIAAKRKRSKWPWIALGGAATGGAVVLILSSGSGAIPPAKKGLPRPPAVP
jgi:hypothetical protein